MTRLRTELDVSAALGITLEMLRSFTAHRVIDEGLHYRRWEILKRGGKTRTITAPMPHLKAAQHWCLKNVFEHLPVHPAAHGFLAGRSIATGATVHAGARLLVQLDVQDFFPSIRWSNVMGLLQRNDYGEGAARAIALLVTEPPRKKIVQGSRAFYAAVGDRSLPQGAPTSPAASNAVCLQLDARLTAVAGEHLFRYSRYADDLSFSFHEEMDSVPLASLLKAIAAELGKDGFTIHPDKTVISRRGQRQRITGLVVTGDTPRAPRETIRRLRAALHNRRCGRPGPESLEQLKGLASFVNMTDPAKGQAFLAEIGELERHERLPV